MARAQKAKRFEPAPVLPVRDSVHFPGLIQTLHVSRRPSITSVQSACKLESLILVVAQADPTVEEPAAAQLYRVGLLSEILQASPMPDGSLRAVLRGRQRVRIKKLTKSRDGFLAEYEALEDEGGLDPGSEALARECIESLSRIVELGKTVKPEVMDAISAFESPGAIADAISHHLPLRVQQKQELLEAKRIAQRLELLYDLLRREERLLKLQNEIRARADGRIADSQRDFFLREQLKAIQAELGEETEASELDQLRKTLADPRYPEDVRSRAEAEIRRLERMPDPSSEAQVIRTHLDWLLELPWSIRSEEVVDVTHAAEVLDRAHFGLSSVKERILDYLAVRQISQSLRGPVLCFLGPPGVGKTSLGRTIAEALGREFASISLGGLRDEAEIRGHRRTYVGAMPGRLVQAIRQSGTMNPVIMLDELDKLASDFRGDPASALLEVLDPQQNQRFSDHYLELPMDLSNVLFIATANVLDGIPRALRERLELVQFSSYSDEERLAIAERFILPRALEQHGLREGQLRISREALTAVVQEHTREAGVRMLEKALATLCRKSARQLAEGRAEEVSIECTDLEPLLGPARYAKLRSQPAEIGVAAGMVVTEYGGDLIDIEVCLLEPQTHQPEMRLTGSLGNVMKESAEAAVTFIRTVQNRLSRESLRHDVHVHVPEGGVSKDGPSAGLAIAVALASALSGRPVRSEVALTGEITLRGRVLPIGGLREKVLAAHRAGIQHVVLPAENMPDFEELPEYVKQAVQAYPVTSAEEALQIALQGSISQALIASEL
ncbi:MAG TPA: endopeptidase La [Fimbriimonadaceae bacterium]|nr:endopeptidase La [Fimbriimonadaceae bacterium]